MRVQQHIFLGREAGPVRRARGMTGPRAAALALGLLLTAALGALALAVVELRQLTAELRLAQTLELAPAALRPPAPPAWAAGLTRVLVAGDSRVARWQPRPEIPGQDLHFTGIGGETTAELRRRLSRDLALYAPERLVLAAGVNDLVAASLNPAQVEDVLAALTGNLEAIITEARAAGSEVILLTILRPARPDLLRRVFAWSPSLRPLVAEANARIRALADPAGGVTVLDVDALIGGSPNAPLPAEFTADTLHLTSAAYLRLNDLLSHVLSR